MKSVSLRYLPVVVTLCAGPLGIAWGQQAGVGWKEYLGGTFIFWGKPAAKTTAAK